MAEVRVKFNVAMVIALVIAEIFSVMWYTHYSPWFHHIGHRYLIPAILCDCIVVYVLKYIKEAHWTCRGWEDMAVLSLWVALFYAGLQGPHYVYDTYSASYFMYHVAHKFVLSFIILFVLHSFKKY